MNEQICEDLEHIGNRDHSVSSEYRIFGPPGTGKTTALTRQMWRAMDRFGQQSALVTSFSKAAAAELTGRDTPIGLDRIGTLHSHCFHLLGRPEIAEIHVEEWNQRNPHLTITPVSREARLYGEDADEDEQNREGDRILQQLNRCRGMLLPSDSWAPEIRNFASKWNSYKKAYNLLDFSDLIETACESFSTAPGNPSVIVVDEAQDLNRMQLVLARQWGKQAEYLVLAGDDDQTIYAWTGASPDAFLNPEIPADHKIFLRHSMRIPHAIHTIAEGFIRQVSRRQEKSYQPRNSNGRVQRLSCAGYRKPEYSILKSAERHLQEGKRIMFLASCSYMLRPLITVLRKSGIPFHNPYRRINGFWNPLRTESRKSATNRILALLVGHPQFGDGHRDWQFRDLELWTDWLRDGILHPDYREAISANVPHQCPSRDFLEAAFTSTAHRQIRTYLSENPRSLLKWWLQNLAPQYQHRVRFPSEIASLHGIQFLRRTPQVVIGTIHSVKGGEADVVYLFPDLSQAAEEQYLHYGSSRDSVLRTFYVGITRAREILYICSPESGRAVSI